MVERERDFAEVQVRLALRNTAIGIQPMLGIAPETLDSVDVLTRFGSTFFLADDNVATAHAKRRVGLPLVGVVETARRLRNAFLDNFSMVTCAERRDADDAVALENAEDNDLSSRPQPRRPARYPPKVVSSSSR